MRLISLPLIILPFLFSCLSPQIPILRELRVVERPEVDIQSDGTGVIRTPHCDISVRGVNDADWKSIASNDVFRDVGFHSTPRPPFEIFFVTIHNSTKRTLREIRFYIRTPGSTDNSLSLNELHAQCPSPAYNRAQLDEIFTMRRLLTQEFRLSEIDLDKDTIGYPFPFLMPNESGALCVAFPIPSFDHRRYTISVEYQSGSEKKVVDFEIERRETRQNE
ncbi:MAG TPA: hypothetical protein VF857_09715 [Spirochaetota bacterium]